jgi:hypothetical protein
MPLECRFAHHGHHHVTPAASSAQALDALLAAGASVNIYMFHGGTNFGLTSGANDKGTYQAITTSYDYDAPLDEAGQPTEKYRAYREVLSRYAPGGQYPRKCLCRRPRHRLLPCRCPRPYLCGTCWTCSARRRSTSGSRQPTTWASTRGSRCTKRRSRAMTAPAVALGLGRC